MLFSKCNSNLHLVTWCGVQTNDVHVAKPRGESRWLATPQKRPMQTSHGKKVPSTGRHHSGTNHRSAYTECLFVSFIIYLHSSEFRGIVHAVCRHNFIAEAGINPKGYVKYCKI